MSDTRNLVPLPKVDYDAGWHRQYTADQMHAHAAAVSAAKDAEIAALRAEAAQLREYLDTAQRRAAALGDEVAGLREALQMWLTLHDNPAGYAGKYGKALDAAIAAQQIKIDAAANAARAALEQKRPEPDCRTCAHHYLNIYENNACEEYAMCTNGDRYEPLPPVRLWRTDART